MPQKKKRVVETFKRSVETLKTRLPAYPLTRPVETQLYAADVSINLNI